MTQVRTYVTVTQVYVTVNPSICQCDPRYVTLTQGYHCDSAAAAKVQRVSPVRVLWVLNLAGSSLP